MRHWKKSLFVTTLLALMGSGSAFAMDKKQSGDSIWIGSYGSISSWNAISRDEIILWASPSRPYLVKLTRPFRSLRFAQTIGVTDTVGRVTKFDKVIVDGQTLFIRSIEKIDKETAKALRQKRKG